MYYKVITKAYSIITQPKNRKGRTPEVREIVPAESKIIEAKNPKEAISLSGFERKHIKDIIQMQPNSYVVDTKAGMGTEYVPENLMPANASVYAYKGQLVYFLIRDYKKSGEVALVAYESHKDILVPPKALNRLLFWEEVKEILVEPRKTNTGLQLGLMVLIVLALGIIIWLMVEGASK